MEEDVTSGVNYYLSIASANRDDLAGIRHWTNLKVAFEDTRLWIKDLDYAQAHSVQVKSLPVKTIYYEKAGRLFLLNSLLPERIVPALLWTPIERGLPIKLPDFNHNYFGIHDRLDVRLVTQEEEKEATAMLLTLDVLAPYITEAPTIRLNKIRWTILNKNEALLIGTPLLPLPGKTYWQRKDMLIPTGYDFDFFLLEDVISKQVNPGRMNITLWNSDGSYISVPKDSLTLLSRSSFRLSVNQLQNAVEP
jgi:hypothetical protein